VKARQILPDPSRRPTVAASSSPPTLPRLCLLRRGLAPLVLITLEYDTSSRGPNTFSCHCQLTKPRQSSLPLPVEDNDDDGHHPPIVRTLKRYGGRHRLTVNVRTRASPAPPSVGLPTCTSTHENRRLRSRPQHMGKVQKEDSAATIGPSDHCGIDRSATYSPS
jgi:hypothetical protein